MMMVKLEQTDMRIFECHQVIIYW